MVALAIEATGIEEHSAETEAGKVVLHLIFIEAGVLWQNDFEQFPQLGNNPLAVAKFVDMAAHSLFGSDTEGTIEETTGSTMLSA